jgi:branched-chain amino acid transport system ATP-binding protein
MTVPAPPAGDVLRVERLNAGYGETQVLWDLSLEIHPGEIVAIIGSNGAGKSTLLGTISGLVKTWSGSVRYGDADLTGKQPDRLVAAGVVQVPQGRRLFGSLTVEENLLMGAFLRRDNEVKSDLERILVMLPRIKQRYSFLAGNLSGGEQQQVAIARALMSRPKVLLIDEMSLGLAPVLVDQLLEIIKTIHATGMSIVMVEQDVQTALEISTRAYVIETGRITLAGPSADLLDDPNVKKAYLGV